MITLKLGGQTYELKVGKKFVLDDPHHIYGNWITITTTDYEVSASRVKDAIDTFMVESIRVLNEDIDTPQDVDLSKLKKGELLKISEELGLNVSPKTTKKELIDLIEGIGDVEC